MGLKNVLAVFVIAHDLAFFHSDDATPHMVDDAFIVCSEDDCGAKLVDFFQNLNDLVGIDRIEIAGRLVSDDNIRLIDDRSGNSHALFFAAGELAREIPCFVAQIDEFEHVRHVRGDLAVGAAAHLHSKSDIFVGGFVWNETKILKNSANAATELAHVFTTQFMNIGRLKKNSAGRRTILGDEHFEQCGLPRAGMSHHGDKFFRLDLKTDALKRHGFIGIDFADFIEVDHVLLLYHIQRHTKYA